MQKWLNPGTLRPGWAIVNFNEPVNGGTLYERAGVRSSRGGCELQHVYRLRNTFRPTSDLELACSRYAHARRRCSNSVTQVRAAAAYVKSRNIKNKINKKWNRTTEFRSDDGVCSSRSNERAHSEHTKHPVVFIDCPADRSLSIYIDLRSNYYYPTI